MATEFKSCSVDMCNSPVLRRGYCSSHYWRLRRHGGPLGGRTPEGEPLRFIHEVALRHTSKECLTWPFGRTSRGYGGLTVDGNMVLAHRYICELVHGAPPTPKHDAAHSCGKGHDACIAPGHLDWKTHAENEADKLEHGTHNRGERCGASKLTEAEARAILSMKGIETQSNLADRFGISSGAIAKIHSGRTWAWLP